MDRLKKSIYGLFLAALLAASSATAGDNSEPARKDFLHFGNMGGLMPTLKLSDLPEPTSDGAKGVIRYCSQCHNPPGPGLRTEKQWARIYWDMYWRMHIMKSQFGGFQVPKYDEGMLIFAYLQKNAMKSVRSGQVRFKINGHKDYIRTCMQCHSLPDPVQYKDRDWDALVSRMKRHMGSMGKVVPDDAETQRIVSYLKQAAVYEDSGSDVQTTLVPSGPDDY